MSYFQNEDVESKNSLNSWKKFYNPGREEVLKLNLYSPEKKKKKEETIQIKKSEGVDMIKLHNSIDRVKKFLPGIMNILSKSSKQEHAEKILYKRLENIEYENNLKTEISNYNKQIQSYKLIRDEKSEELIKLNSEINDIELDINMLTDVSRFTMIEKERNDLLKEVQINKENLKIMRKNTRKLGGSAVNLINTNENFKTISNNNETKNEDNSDPKKRASNMIKTQKNFGTQQLELLFLRASQSRSKKIKEYKSKLPPKQNKKKEIILEIKEQNRKIEKLRYQKNIKVDQLYTHYLKILKEGKDTRSEGLAWIIREIYNLGKEIIMSYLPDFIDEMGIRFIFKQAKIGIELHKLNDQIEETKNELNESGFSRITNNKKTIFSENEEKLQFDNYLQYKIRRDQNGENFHSKNINLSNSNLIPPVLKLKDVQEIIKNSEIHISPSQMEILIKYLSLNAKRKDIKKIQHKLRKNEMDRIFEEYLRNDYYQRFKVEKNVVLSALIGEDNILPELNKQMRQARKYFDSLKACGMHQRDDNLLNLNGNNNMMKMFGKK